ncbi:MAG: peptidoglycan editing factor PgeF [Polyangiaceae bacterium]
MAIAYFSDRLKKAGFRHEFSTRLASQAQIGEALGVSFDAIARVKQVHSARVALVSGEGFRSDEADALVSRAGAAIAIQTADCVPILVADPSSGAVAAIHAGWRGVVSGIAKNALDLLGGNRAELVAAIGPCICGACFEVGADVAEKIVVVSNADVVVKRVDEKAFVDLRNAVRAQLVAAGLSNARIEDVAGCTFHQNDLFFSYRREGATAGRLIAAIRPRS